MSECYFSFTKNRNALAKAFIICACCILFTSPSSNAQVNVTGNQTATALAQALVGSGVVVMNPTLTCPAVANGIFSVVSSNLGLSAGIVLTSGRAQTQGSNIGINGPSQDDDGPSNDNNAAGDAQLTALAGQQTHDACVLQFDFKPSGDTIKFNYVFGSVEYQDYACSDFNDVFGFFISGPGYATPLNVAVVPGTTIPVSVNSVNDGATGGNSISVCNAIGPGSPFSQYYVDNSAGTTITYFGLTTVLQAIAAVSPCDTYHLKMGVADASDGALDSGVFIEAGSLTSTSINVTSVGINGSIPYCVRGCLPGKFIFSLPSPTTSPYTIHYVVAGNAVNGFDYTTIPDSVTVPAQASTDTLLINPLAVPPTGPKTVKIYILAQNSCDTATNIVDSASLIIYDSFSVHIVTPDTAICLGQSVHIITQSDSLLTYVWSPAATLNNDTTLSPVATPLTTTTYTILANFPGAGCIPSKDQINITVYQPPALTTPLVVNTCLGIPAQLYVNATPATQAYTYSWSPATYLNNAAIDSAIATPTALGDITYTVTVNTVLPNCSSTDTIHLHILPNSFTVGPTDTTICLGQSVQINANGDAEFTYVWTPAAGVSNPNIIAPVITPPPATGSYPDTAIYFVTASYPGCPNMVDSVGIILQTPAPTIPVYKATCVDVPIQFDVTPPDTNEVFQFSWAPVTYLDNPAIATPVSTPTVAGDITYIVTVTPGAAGCTTFDTVTLHVVPNDFTIFNSDTAVCKPASIQVNASGDTEFAYTWIPTIGVSNYQVIDPLLTPDTSQNYTITATYPGCPPMVHTLFIDVQPNPSVFLVGSRFVCQFDTVHLNATVTPWGYPNYIYTWTPSTQLTDTTTPDAIYTADSTGTFSIVLNVSTPAGCQSEDSAYVTVYPGQFATLLPANDTAICPGDSVQFLASGAALYQWSPGGSLSDSTTSNPVAYPTATQNYNLIATSQYGCHDTFNVNIVVHPAALLSLGDSVTLYPGETYQMNAQGNCLNYSWFPPLGLSAINISNPIASPDVNTKYIVTATTEWGCAAVDSINIYVDPNTLLAVPNGFSPGNGPNNELKIIKRGIATLNYFRIFNRWGEQVFETTNIDDGWDGTYKGAPQPFGVYVYEIEAETNAGRRFVKQGNITLIR